MWLNDLCSVRWEAKEGAISMYFLSPTKLGDIALDPRPCFSVLIPSLFSDLPCSAGAYRLTTGLTSSFLCVSHLGATPYLSCRALWRETIGEHLFHCTLWSMTHRSPRPSLWCWVTFFPYSLVFVSQWFQGDLQRPLHLWLDRALFCYQTLTPRREL
jgi:hypothetical protein